MRCFNIVFFSFILFSGCGETTTQENNTTIELPEDTTDYSNTQWYKDFNEEFFIANDIDSNAHINPENTYSRYKGSGVKIAIIDDGFDTTHYELENRIYKTINFTNSGLLSDVSHTYSNEYHGTAVAGIIASGENKYGITGIAPNSQLILIKMSEYSSDTETIDMFKAAVDAGADIINCSWGTGDVSSIVSQYIDTIATNGRDSKGVIVVFAAGNNNYLMDGDESALETVIGVGATDHTALRTSYSDYGPDLDVVAPGGGDYYGDYGISTLDPIGDNGITDNDLNLYNEMRNGSEVSFIGTSAAAPIVSGAIALMLESNPNLTRVEIQTLLKSTSDKIGLNIPYLKDFDIINSQTPMFTGQLGTSNNSDFSLRLISNEDIAYGPYSISIQGDKWSSQVTDILPFGFYSAQLVSNEEKEEDEIFATDSYIEINNLKEPLSNELKNDYYGYGKINLSKLIEASLELY